METSKEIIKQNGKEIMVKSFIPGKYNKDEMLLFVTGLVQKPTTFSLDDVVSEEFFSKNYARRTNMISSSFNWFASSNKNSEIANFDIDEYCSELKIIINFLRAKFNIKNIHLITNSFGSVPAFEISRKDSQIKKVILRGPVFDSSVREILFRIKKTKEYEKIFSIKGAKFKKMTTNYKERNLKYSLPDHFKIKKSDKIKSGDIMLQMGSEEFFSRKEKTENFAKINNIKNFVILEGAGHIVYREEGVLPGETSELTEKLRKFSNDKAEEFIMEVKENE